jgi:outer membrane scaffolding protein for murein synthesis (MipA/OmpV family)
LPLWEIGVFGGSAVTPAYPAAGQRSTRSLLLPFLIYRGKVVRADRSGIGARLLRSERLELDVGLAASLPARSSDVPARANMPDLGTLLEFGPRLKVALARPTPSSRLTLELPLRAVLEARSGLHHRGWTFEPKLVADLEEGQGGEQGKWLVTASVAAVLGDARLNNYFYEVAPQFATPERAPYSASAGLVLLRAGLSGSRLINDHLRVFGFVRLENYASSANDASALHTKSNGVSAGVGFAWSLKQSRERAR